MSKDKGSKMRRQTNQNIDDLFGRHNPLRGNTVNPNVFFTPMWLREENQSSVEIIELNSSNEVEPSSKVNKDADGDNRDRYNAWSFANNPQTNEPHKINEKARERRRMKNDTTPSSYKPSEHNNNYNNGIPNDFCKRQLNDHMQQEILLNHQINCFTILNKHLMNADISTDEEYDEVEIITSDDLIMDSGSWETHNIFNEEIITYDTNVDQNPRTIWIYSYKNKQLLSCEDIDEKDMPSKLTDSSNSDSNTTDSSGEQCKKSLRENKETSRRIGSPIPLTFVPRLDLSLVPTLSTVSEGSEQKSQTTTSGSRKCNNVNKSSNNWFVSESAKVDGVRSVRKIERSTNIINWMGLSPRQKRRVLKDKSCSDTWVGPNLLNLTDKNNSDKHLDETYVTYLKRDSVNILVDAEVHADFNKNMENTTEMHLNKTKNDEAPTKNKMESASEFEKDRGDHCANQGAASSIHVSPIIPKDPDIATHRDPSSKSDYSNRVNENEIETAVYDYAGETIKEKSEQSALDETQFDNFVDHWWMKNTVPFLKPSQWVDFKPIADSPVSCYLSIGSTVEDRQRWYTRLINFLLCCR